MHCRDMQWELESYIDGDLNPGQATLLEQHLAGCDDCQVELARLQTVVAALESWPLVVEPAQLTTRVMTQIKQPLPLPTFRIRWSDVAISATGAGLVAVALLAWRALASTDQGRLFYLRMILWLEMLSVRATLWAQSLLTASVIPWPFLLVGLAFTAFSILFVCGLIASRPVTDRAGL